MFNDHIKIKDENYILLREYIILLGFTPTQNQIKSFINAVDYSRYKQFKFVGEKIFNLLNAYILLQKFENIYTDTLTDEIIEDEKKSLLLETKYHILNRFNFHYILNYYNPNTLEVWKEENLLGIFKSILGTVFIAKGFEYTYQWFYGKILQKNPVVRNIENYITININLSQISERLTAVFCMTNNLKIIGKHLTELIINYIVYKTNSNAPPEILEQERLKILEKIQRNKYNDVKLKLLDEIIGSIFLSKSFEDAYNWFSKKILHHSPTIEKKTTLQTTSNILYNPYIQLIGFIPQENEINYFKQTISYQSENYKKTRLLGESVLKTLIYYYEEDKNIITLQSNYVKNKLVVGNIKKILLDIIRFYNTNISNSVLELTYPHIFEAIAGAIFQTKGFKYTKNWFFNKILLTTEPVKSINNFISSKAKGYKLTKTYTKILGFQVDYPTAYLYIEAVFLNSNTHNFLKTLGKLLLETAATHFVLNTQSHSVLNELQKNISQLIQERKIIKIAKGLKINKVLKHYNPRFPEQSLHNYRSDALYAIIGTIFITKGFDFTYDWLKREIISRTSVILQQKEVVQTKTKDKTQPSTVLSSIYINFLGFIPEKKYEKDFIKAVTLPAKNSKNNYERLEFLGDAVLGAAVSYFFLFQWSSNNENSKLFKKKQDIVSGKTLAYVANKLNLYDLSILYNPGIKRNKIDKVMDDLLEAIIGAIFVAKNFHFTYTWIRDKIITPIFRYEANVYNILGQNKNLSSQLINKEYKKMLGFIPSSQNIKYFIDAVTFKDNFDKLSYLGMELLKTIAGYYYFNKYPDANEGILTMRRQEIISNLPLRKIARRYFPITKLVNHYNPKGNGRDVEKNTNRILTAIIGAIFLEKGFEFTYQWFYKKVLSDKNIINFATLHSRNYIEELQKYCSKKKIKMEIVVKKTKDKRVGFVYLNNNKTTPFVKVSASSKKDARKLAAKKALEKLGAL